MGAVDMGSKMDSIGVIRRVRSNGRYCRVAGRQVFMGAGKP